MGIDTRMADVVSIKGDKIDAAFDERSLLARLKDIVVKIEAGEIKPEKWILLVETPRPDNPAIISTKSYDSGVTVAEAVYLMSGGIYDLHWKVRQEVP